MLDTRIIDSWLKEKGVGDTSPNKMRIYQNFESIENTIKEDSKTFRMELRDDQVKVLIKYYTYPNYVRIVKGYQQCYAEPMRAIITSVKNKLVNVLQDISNQQITKPEERREGKLKKVFISYSWEDTEHNEWVHNLASKLSSDFEVIIDARLPLGSDLNSFMEKMVSESDRVIIVLTPKYKEKADKRNNGVGYESMLISSEIYLNQESVKFIPIIRRGCKEDSYPKFLANRKGLDMTNDAAFEDRLITLIEDINAN